MAGIKKPKEQSKTWQRRQAGIEKRKLRQRATVRRREVAQQAQKLALEKVAEEAFGEGGLTPERHQALSAVIVGPEGGDLSINNPTVLRHFVRKAKRKFLEHADRYIDIHINSTEAAMQAGEFDVAAKHAEWAMEAFGVEGEHVVTPAPKSVQTMPSTPPIMVGVNLGIQKRSDD